MRLRRFQIRIGAELAQSWQKTVRRLFDFALRGKELAQVAAPIRFPYRSKIGASAHLAARKKKEIGSAEKVGDSAAARPTKFYHPFSCVSLSNATAAPAPGASA